MKKYLVKNRKRNEVCGKFSSKNEATTEMIYYINEHNFNKDESCEDFLTPFDFYLEKIEVTEPNETITDFDSARKALHGCPNTAFKVVQRNPNDLTMLSMLSEFCLNANPHHVKALIALNKLLTIAEAWNKVDKFVPDFSNPNQYKWFPWFKYSDDAAGFVSAYTANTASNASAYFGSRLCFKSEERATQFGKQFIDLWNEFLLFDKNV